MAVFTRPEPVIERDAPIPTWFGIGGGARRLARPASLDALRGCLEIDPELRLLGDGANLLVEDDGVDELVVALDHAAFRGVEFGPDGSVSAGAGANLPRLILEAVRRGLGGLEGLGGIPATVGGAVVMNAGGAFGQIADAVRRVWALDRRGNEVCVERPGFAYRRSGLERLIVTRVDLGLHPGDPAALRRRLKEVMEYKKRSQPMAERSAGCVFKNPVLGMGVEGIGAAAERISAGMLIDRAGCKGMSIGGAMVGPGHANFITTGAGARAADVLMLMERVAARVADRFGVALEPEVVIWRSRR